MILSFTQAFASALFIVTLQHSNVSKLITVCLLSYKFLLCLHPFKWGYGLIE